jgi:phosphoglycerate kinase
MTRLRTIDDLDVTGERVLLRVDLNVPLRDEPDGTRQVADDTRIRAALPTIQELRRRGAKLILVSHLGRPHGREESFSLRPVATRLSELTGAPVTLAPTVVGPEVDCLARALAPGDMLMLENVRFEPGETTNDPRFSAELAALADRYVNDAFGAAHRAHASTEGVAHLLPCAAGRLMQREVETLAAIMDSPPRPLVAVLGGAKVAEKVGVVEHFLKDADSVLIGGAMSLPFLAAQGHALGASTIDERDLQTAQRVLKTVAASGGSLELPEDLVIARECTADAERRTLEGLDVPDGWMVLDIGSHTATRFAATISGAASVFWNGPMGVFELEAFAHGTRTVADAVAGASGLTVVGGGETVQAVREYGLERRISHLSTGGGATLELLQGHSLPGVQALADGRLRAAVIAPEAVDQLSRSGPVLISPRSSA